MRKRGPKTLYRDYMMDQAYKLGALGLTETEIAEFWNISYRTLARWIQKNPTFRHRIKQGAQQADITVIQALLAQAQKGNITAAIFWLKNRQPQKWNDRIPTPEQKVMIFNKQEMSEDELNKRITERIINTGQNGNGRSPNPESVPGLPAKQNSA